MKNSRLAAPKHLSREAKRWWSRIIEAWELDDAAFLILESALEAFDRMRQAQVQVKKKGITIKDRFKQEKMNPAVLVERDAKATMLRALKALALDLEPLHDGPGRPPGSERT